MTPVTNFTIKDPYEYLWGFGNYHQSEALAGANPAVINTPQKVPYSLRTERITNTSFTAPRHQNYQTWLYRARSSLDHSTYEPLTSSDIDADVTHPAPPKHTSPNSYFWPAFPTLSSNKSKSAADWSSAQRLLARNGDPQEKRGLALYVFAVTRDMDARAAFCSMDGETLIVPQSGALDLQTELGRMMVRQNEIAVVPRGVRYRVTLPGGGDGNKKKPCRGYTCELFEGHFVLPDLGTIGSTGLANARDFQIPTACFDGSVDGQGVARANTTEGGEWTITSRLAGRLWTCTQPSTPFDVAGWHGTCYPYKYDLARFCPLGNVAFDHHDPCLFNVLTAPAYGRAPGTAIVDFALIGPRWMTPENTYRLPYFHRNTMQEFYAPIVHEQSDKYPFNGSDEFGPFGAGLNGWMTTHGASEEEYAEAMSRDTTKPAREQQDGFSLFLLETECPLYLSEWAVAEGVQNFRGQEKAKM